jgi:hypothetical protein
MVRRRGFACLKTHARFDRVPHLARFERVQHGGSRYRHNSQAIHLGFVTSGQITLRHSDHEKIHVEGDSYVAPPGELTWKQP